MVKIRSKTILPLIQGGMGVGVSLSRLAGNVALNNCMGVISTAQIGFRDFSKRSQFEKNIDALKEEIKKAREISKGNGMIAINAMVAGTDYKQMITTAVESGIDAIISGAGLPLSLPEIVGDADVALAPIVSSAKAFNLILRAWQKKAKRLPDFIVIEGFKAGGHLGFSKKDIATGNIQPLEDILKDCLDLLRQKELDIPVFVAGGIYDKEDIKHFMDLGASGVQMATRFIATDECDASDAFKQVFVNASKDDIDFVISPVGLDGRCINTKFTKALKERKPDIVKCTNCLIPCNYPDTPYCISQALVNAVNGDIENGLVFSGVNGYRITEIVPVKQLIEELMEDYL